jgi:hypothetical protein
MNAFDIEIRFEEQAAHQAALAHHALSAVDGLRFILEKSVQETKAPLGIGLVLLTILVTALSKGAIKVGMTKLRDALKHSFTEPGSKDAMWQFIIVNPVTGSKHPFSISKVDATDTVFSAMEELIGKI